MLDNASTLNTSNLENVRILNRVRFVAILGKLALLLIASWVFSIPLPISWMLIIILLEVSFQIYAYQVVRNKLNVKTIELFCHLLIDSILLSGLIYFSGGASNPFISLLLLSVALASFMLPSYYLLAIVTIQLILYSLLNLYQRPMDLSSSDALNSFHFHLVGMWINFILTAILIATFGLLTRRTLISQENKLHHMREKHIQDEQVLSLGIISANAAHQLGTPLSTMAILVDDLLHTDLDDNVKKDLEIISSQLTSCEENIGALRDKSRQARKRLSRAESSEESSGELIRSRSLLVDSIRSIIDGWTTYRPKIKVNQEYADNLCSIHLSFSISLEQALTNLLDNAADASLQNGSDQIRVLGYLERDNLLIDIIDFGRGLLVENQKTLGTRIQSSDKEIGLGWGMLLSNVSIERVGGSVEVLEDEKTGTLIRVSIPLALAK